ncbi:uncharacterized protein ACNS7B_006883 isoform 2-T2 [Menidia menidia]
MRCSTLKGFLVILLMQQCTSEGVSTSTQSPTEVTDQDGQTLPREQEVSAAEVVPVVSPPSLKDVQQAVQEASEQVEGRGAEEVLKELLERVVEAALGKAEGGSEENGMTVAEEDVQGSQVEESVAEAVDDVLEQPLEHGDTDKEGEPVGSQETEVVVENDTFENGEEKGAVQGEGDTAAGLVEESTETVETEVSEEEGLDVVKELLGSEFSQEDTEGDSEEAEGDLEVQEEGDEGQKEQTVLSVEKAETTAMVEPEEAPAPVEVAVDVQPKRQTVKESDPILRVVDEEQMGNDQEQEAAPKEETPTNANQTDATALPSNDHEIKATQPIEREQDEDEEGIETEDTEGPIEGDGDQLFVEGGTQEEVEEDADLTGETGDVKVDDGVMKNNSEVLVNEGGGKKVGEDTVEDSLGSDKEDQEILGISGPLPENVAEDSTEQNPEIHPPTSNPPPAEVENQENTLGQESSDHGNEPIIPTLGILPHDPAVALPTRDDLENDVVAGLAQTEGEEPGEANEQVEDVPAARETSDQDLEAWKIGAIFASVFLVIETVVIIVYILKCRTQKSSLDLQRTCEEGCVEPEAATGGDCSDDTLPVGNTQQIAMLNSSNAAPAKERERHKDEHPIAMSDLPPSSNEEGAETGPGSDSSADLKTSI